MLCGKQAAVCEYHIFGSGRQARPLPAAESSPSA
jgi:hypothetical protein